MPDPKTRIPFERKFSTDEFNRLSVGLVPVKMEDKWFIFMEEDHLYFHRSWTGKCIYIVEFRKVGNDYLASQAWLTPEEKRVNVVNHQQLILALIDNLLLRK